MPVTSVVGNAVTQQYTVTTTLPNTLAAGTYQVRVLASNPNTIGSVGTTPLVVKSQPTTAPTLAAQSVGDYTSRFTFCQNDPPFLMSALVGEAPDNYRVLYDVGTALSSTNRASFTAPFLSTTQTGVATYNVRYVVIDNTKGCNPAEQPGSVSYLQTEVKTQPAAPSLSVTALTYCQFQPATPLMATLTTPGSVLRWYDANGNLLASQAPTPTTTQSGTATYRVSQVLSQCEGPKAQLTVNIGAASPAPTTTKTRIDLCRGAVATPLTASGTNLIWTTPTGTTSTVAPTPSTLNASKTADGDVYYVSQTIGNGCPSARLAIAIFVQAQPTLSLSGGKNINLGQELPLQLTFTGTGPYRYKITTSPGSTILSGSASKDTTLILFPEQSATYQIAEVSNACGVGLPGSPATATVIVLIPTIRTLPLLSTSTCAGSTVTVSFQTTGTFNAGSTFRLQLSPANTDTTKLSYADMPTTQQAGTLQLTGTLPASATSGTYLIRVVATNSRIPILGASSPTTLTVIGQATASLSTSTSAIFAGETAKLIVNFTGNGPWTFVYLNSSSVGTVSTRITNSNPYIDELIPLSTATYSLVSVSNGCGLTTNVSGRVTVTVSPLLAVEPVASRVKVYPVPADAWLTVQIDPTLLTQAATLTLFDSKGRAVLTQTTRQQTTQLWLADQPAGLYVVQILVDGQQVSRRVMKH